MSILNYKLKLLETDNVEFIFVKKLANLTPNEITEINNSHSKCFGSIFESNKNICILKFNNEIVAYCVILGHDIWSVCKTIKGDKYKGICKRLIAEVAKYYKNTLKLRELFLYVRISGTDPLGNTGKNIAAIKCYQSNNFKFVHINKNGTLISKSNNQNKKGNEFFTEMRLDLTQPLIDPNTIHILRIFKENESLKLIGSVVFIISYLLSI